MSAPDALAPPFAIGDLHRSVGGELEGWCHYPDQPGARATVELLCNGEVVRAVRTTRLRTDLRALGIGDGFYGFWFPRPNIPPNGPRTVLEVREQRLGTIIGRIVVGGASARESRLNAAASVVGSVAVALDGLDPNPGLPNAIETLGRTLLFLATRPPGRRVLGLPGLQACLQQVGDLPAADFGWCTRPRFSVIVPAAGNLTDLAARLRGAARVLHGSATEILLLDDGAIPSAALLPTRLRGLVLVRVARSARWGCSLNTAAAAARGEILAFARPGGPGVADLAGAVDLAPGTLGLDATFVPGSAAPGPTRCHLLHCVVARADLAAMGGFDPVTDEDALWGDLLAKASVLGLSATTWKLAPLARLPGMARR